MKLEGKIKHGIALAIDHNDYVDCDVVYYGGMTIRLVNASYDDLSIAFGPVGSYVDMTQYYTKEEIDNKGYLTEHQDISGKADKVDTYTKTETDTLLLNSNMQSVTWSELVTLRNSSQLVRGCLYRVTDYQCTTIQDETRSANHQFDIITSALDTNKLSEQCWACEHENDGDVYTVTFDDEVVKQCYIYRVDYYHYNVVDVSTKLGTTLTTLVQVAQITEHHGEPLYRDSSMDTEINGVQMYCWFNKEVSEGFTESETPSIGDTIYDGKGGFFDIVYSFISETNVQIEVDSEHNLATAYVDSQELDVEGLTYRYFQNSNLSAWKVWYCLDNDESRFGWAANNATKVITPACINGTHYRESSRDLGQYYAFHQDGNNTNSATLYTTSEEPQVGDTIYLYRKHGITATLSTVTSYTQAVYEEITGKGVIYRLIDEFGNDCPYDFKNIMFYMMVDDYGVYSSLQSNYYNWLYTFSYSYYSNDDDSYYITDAVLHNGELSGDEYCRIFNVEISPDSNDDVTSEVPSLIPVNIFSSILDGQSTISLLDVKLISCAYRSAYGTYLKSHILLNDESITTEGNLALKANLASPSFTGTPTAPTATFGDNSQKIANTSFVSSAVANYARTRTQLSGTTFNTMLTVGTTYIFGTTSAPCTSLTITLQTMTSSATKLYEYHAIIYCANNMTFSYPSSIRIANDKTLPTFASGHVFEIDIVENVMDFNYTTL